MDSTWETPNPATTAPLSACSCLPKNTAAGHSAAFGTNVGIQGTKARPDVLEEGVAKCGKRLRQAEAPPNKQKTSSSPRLAFSAWREMVKDFLQKVIITLKALNMTLSTLADAVPSSS